MFLEHDEITYEAMYDFKESFWYFIFLVLIVPALAVVLGLSRPSLFFGMDLFFWFAGFSLVGMQNDVQGRENP